MSWHQAGSVPWDVAQGDISSVKCKTIFFLFFSFNAASWGGRDEGDGHLNWDQLQADNTLMGVQSCRQTHAQSQRKKKKPKEKRKKKRQ